jgi:hypothetical protein
MPAGLAIDLVQLVRVCLNDPSAREEIAAGLAEGPAPIRTSFGLHLQLDGAWDVLVKTDRERAPGDAGFVARDASGRLVTVLFESLRCEPDSSTWSAPRMAERLGMSSEELARMLAGQPPPEKP